MNLMIASLKQFSASLLGLGFSYLTVAQSCIDADGNVYNTVQVGSQMWMAENLRTSKYANGDDIPSGLTNGAWANTTVGAYDFPGNDPSNDSTYGKLYNGYAVMDPRGICPAGWSVPSDSAWVQLEIALGLPEASAFTFGMRGVNENVGGQLKSTALWASPNQGATNSSGFSALASGNRDNSGAYPSMFTNGDHWTSTEEAAGFLWGRYVYSFSSGIYRSPSPVVFGFSCRCVWNSTIGLDESDRDPSTFLTLFPNPTTGPVTLTRNNAAHAGMLQVFDAVGQLVVERTLRAGEGSITLDLSGQPSGIYVVSLRSNEGGREMVRIVKE